MTSLLHIEAIISVLVTSCCCWALPTEGTAHQQPLSMADHHDFLPEGPGPRLFFKPQSSSSVMTKIEISNANGQTFRNLLKLGAQKLNPKPTITAASQTLLMSQAALPRPSTFQKHNVSHQTLHSGEKLEARESTSTMESHLTTSNAPKHRWHESKQRHSNTSSWMLVPFVNGRDKRPTIRNGKNKFSDVSSTNSELNLNLGVPTNTQTSSQELPLRLDTPFSPNFAPNQQWTLEQLEQHLNKPVAPDAAKYFQALFGENGFKFGDQRESTQPNFQLTSAQLASNDVLDFNLTDPENFQVPSSNKQVFQPPVGGKCFLPYSFVGGDGVCIAAKDCPTTLAMMAQFEYTHIRTYLLDSICRWEESDVYYCCPLYSTSTVLPGGLKEVVPLPPVSPAAAPLPTDCGNVLQRNPRIIGGVVVEEGEFPWLASIGTVNPRDSSRFVSICSGTLISRRHVLTAAHCYRSFSTSTPTIVRLAEGDLFDNDESSVHDDFIVTSLHAPLFYYYSTVNDVMILTLDRDVTFNDYIQPACLPLSSPFLPAPGDTVTAVGYGNTQESGTSQVPARYPYQISLPVVSNSECQNAYYALPPIYIVDDRVFCEGGLTNRSTCKGDSGGPLHYWDESKERYLVVGVVNAGIGCGVEGNPSIDLRVGAFLPWIQTVIAG
ncbi:Serine proteases trypsin domain [Trinorchestia longiramus]|nr:Serine proteases trypsin domain [Trinorchestia longiramus]